MTLTTRLSLFFLLLLGLVLAGFSLTLHGLARSYLQRQAEERLHAALNILAAAVEVAPDGVEWEPAERVLSFAPTAEAQLFWIVSDEDGRIVDHSAAPGAEEFLRDVAGRLKNDTRVARRVEWQGERWQVSQRWVVPSADPGEPRHTVGPGEKKHTALAVTAGVALQPLRAALRSLAWTLAGVSLGVWLFGLGLSRFVCRRALRPVSHMTASARAMDAGGLDQRLPVPASGDELEELSRAFNGLLDRLQESFERQRRFTGDASHQLRTPLTAALGQIEVALRRERTGDEYRHLLGRVQRQARHLQRIVEALLFLTRADADARSPEREPLDLAAWLEEHLRAWSEHPRAGDLHAKIPAAAPLTVAAQPALLGEMVNTLLENACKYSTAGTPITVTLARTSDGVRLTVADRGCGVSEADLPHLGEPFFRAPNARQRGITGVGLGLAIAKRIAAALGGELSFTSREGVGSEFTVSLPGVAVTTKYEATLSGFSPSPLAGEGRGGG